MNYEKPEWQIKEEQDREILRTQGAILRADIENPEAAIERVVRHGLGTALPEDPAFAAFVALEPVGPRNDWNGLRSASQNLQIKWCIEILTPACKQIKAAQNP